jgi:PAS domain S-box-containing protein
LLVRREGDQILFLNELRHRKNTAAYFRLPLASENLLSARVLRGEAPQNEAVLGRDYRNLPSIGVARSIPETDWLLMAKIDRAEMFKDVFLRSTWISLAGLLAVFLSGAGVVVLHQREQMMLTESIRQSQDERLRALSLLAAIADGSEDAIFAKDLEGRYILFNRAAERFVGKTAEEVLGYDDRAIFPPEQAEMLISVGQQVIVENRSLTREETLDTVQGSRTFLAIKGPLRDSEGKINGIYGISRDISARIRAEASLRESEQRFHDIAEASADWIWEVDADFHYTYASESVRNLLGYSSEEILGKTPFELMPPHEVERQRVQFTDLATRYLPFRDLEIINQHKDGSLRHISVSGTPILDEQDRLRGYRGLDRDITARKSAQEAPHRQAEELRNRNEELERFNRAMIGRELEMIELKRQVNVLSRELGRAPPYPLAFLEDAWLQ